MRILMICGLAALQAAAQDNSWKIEIDNSLVRVERRIVAPRETVAPAEMPPALLVFLTDYSVRLTTASLPQEMRGKPGQFLWHPAGRIGVENLSEDRVEVVRVTPKFSPGPKGASAAGGSRNVVFDNDLIRVIHVHFPRGGTAPMHLVRPRVAVHLSAAHLRLTHADGRVQEFRVKAGEIRFDARGAFSGENLGDALEVLRIELKAGTPDHN